MAGHSDDDVEDLLAAWHAHKESEKLFAVLPDPMRQAARQGIRRILRRTPDEADVNDVLFKAFKEVLEDNTGEVRRSPLGFAAVVAYRRGLDRARSIIREREQIGNQAWELDQRRVTAADIVAAAERERLLCDAEDCMDRLTAEQRDVIGRRGDRGTHRASRHPEPDHNGTHELSDLAGGEGWSPYQPRRWQDSSPSGQ
jgi:DNA-directed RNA polymerase specialized sigma24 family protein